MMMKAIDITPNHFSLERLFQLKIKIEFALQQKNQK